MASFDLLSIMGWYILPNLVTGWVQSAYYAVWIRAGDPKPQAGSRQFISDYKRIYVTVVLAYLAYTIYEADYSLQQSRDFYHSLGVPLDVDERGLLSKFRRLTIQYHPDKIAPTVDRQFAEAFYVHLKNCRDVLVDPVKRFAYDRIGPEILEWRDSKTIYDFVWTSGKGTITYYVGSSVVIFVLSFLGYMKYGSFWRYLAIAAMCTFELHTLTRPESPAILTKVVNPIITTFTNHPPYLQFQLVTLMRKILVSFFIALSQVGPIMFPEPAVEGKEPTHQQLDRLDAMVKTTQQEALRLTALELTPFMGNEQAMQELRVGMRQWLVDNTIRMNPQVRDAMGRVLQPRAQAQPNGRPA
ncbi:DnaJ domain-containing protein 14 [Elsinoe australis]|uniref:DnaJ domain-containing protein 14 n=1 Tax=Elsinoe australis TaxID=40998 RepID=A0A4U7ASN4_9PEZI|nr:DnaJ domain-containing protein 14 [Elsinoe australis]